MSTNTDYTDHDSTDTDSQLPAYLPDLLGGDGERRACVPDDDPERRREDHPDDLYQVAGAAVDNRTPERPRPHADPLVDWIELDTGDSTGFALASVDNEEAFVVAGGADVVNLGGME